MAESMTPDQQATLQELLIEAANGAKIVRYFNLASWLFCTYDWIINLDREIELIWKLKFTSMTYFYFFNRYISGIFLTISMFTYVQEYYIGDTFCQEWWTFEGFTFTICFQLVELVLGLRVWALWKKSKVIGFIIGFFFILEILAMFIVIGLDFTNNFTATDTPFGQYGIEDFHLCTPTTNIAYVYSFWFPTLAYGTVIAALAGWIGIKRYRYTCGGATTPTGKWLLDIFIRDSLIYYILLALLELCMSILWYIGVGPTPQLLVGIAMAAPIVLCSKLILNLRGAYYDYNADSVWKTPAWGPTALVGSPQGAEMMPFGGTSRSKAGQASSVGTKRHMAVRLYSGDSTTRECSGESTSLHNDDEWATEHPSK